MLSDLSHGKGSLITKIVLGIVFLLMLSSLVIMDVRGVISGSAGNGVAAKVNGERITLIDLQKELQRMAQRTGVSAEQARDPQFINYVLQSMVADKLTEQGLGKLSLRFSDKQVARELKTLLTDPLNPSKEGLALRYQMALRQSGMSEKEFESTVRTSLAQRLVNESLEAGKLPDPLMANVNKALAAEKRDIVFINIPVKPDSIKITAEAKTWMDEFYQANLDKFMTPETRKGRVFILAKAQIDKNAKDDPQNYIMEIEDAFAGSEDAASVAKQYELTQRPATEAELAGDDVDAGMVGNAMPLDNGNFGFVAVDDITPAKPKGFASVETDLQKLWQQKQAFEQAQELAAKLKSASDPLAEARAQGDKVFLSSRESVSPQDDVKPLFETSGTNKLIDLPTLENGDLRFGVVRSITPGDSQWQPAKATLADFKAAQSDKASTLYADQLLSYWYDMAKINVNDAVVQTLAQAAPQ